MKLTEAKINEAQKVIDAVWSVDIQDSKIVRCYPIGMTGNMKTDDIVVSLADVWRERDEAVELLRAENERQSKELAEQSIKLLVLNEVVSERDKAIELLRAVVSAAKEYEETAPAIITADRWLFENVKDYT